MTTVAEIKAPRPAKKQAFNDEQKVYEFEMTRDWSRYKPVDKKTEKPLGSPYPPVYGLPNEGIAWDADFDNGVGKTKGKVRNWRYIEGQPSIWVDEQPQLENYEKQEIYTMLGQSENQLELRNGKLIVRGMQKTRLHAMMVQDEFEGNEKQYKPQPYSFRLVNPDVQVQIDLTSIQLTYDAMNMAMNCSVEEMLAVCFIMGINIDDITEAGINRIKKEFLLKAQYDPKNPKGIEFFMSVMNNPATRIKYVFSQGLSQGVISINQQPGKLTWAKPNTPALDLVGKIGLIDELTAMVIDKNDKAIKVLEEVEKQLK